MFNKVWQKYIFCCILLKGMSESDNKNVREKRMDKLKRYQIFDGTMLKMIAMISMVFDHAGALFFPVLLWPRMIGRIAMPVFSFCIAEGYIHTRDKNKYLLRMGIFALISEMPFDLAFSEKIDFSHQNIMFSFFLSILALRLFDLIRGLKKTDTDKYSRSRTIFGCLEVFAMAILNRCVYVICWKGQEKSNSVYMRAARKSPVLKLCLRI